MFNLFGKRKTLVEISPSIIVFTVAFLGLLYFLYFIHNILVIFFMAFIMMVALNPAVNKLEKIIKSRLASIITIYFLVLLVISSIFAFLLPPLANQLIQLLKLIDLPYLQEYISELRFTATELNDLANNFSSSINALTNVITSTFRSLFTFLTLIVVSFYLIIDEPRLHLKLSWITNRKKHLKITRQFLDDLEEQLGGWVRGQIILMTVIGVITYVGLLILKVPYALPLALIAGLLEILPNLGPTLSAIPAIIIAYINLGYINSLMVVAFYILVQQLENNLIVPKIMQKNADVNPLIGIMSILIGFQVYGVIGGLLSIPVYIVIRTVYSYWKKYKKSLSPDW